VKLLGSKPLTLNSPYGQVTVQSLTPPQYLKAVEEGKIETGDLVFQTRHSSWNQTGVRSSGYDTAIAINDGRNHHNGHFKVVKVEGGKSKLELPGSLVYGDATQSVFVLRNDVRQMQFAAQLMRGGGAPSAIARVQGAITSNRGSLSMPQLLRLALDAGFNRKQAITMAAIIMAESGGKPREHNNNPQTGDDSLGLAQINMLGSLLKPRLRQFGISDKWALLDPTTNLRAAWQVFNEVGGNFSPWSVFRSNAYSAYLPAARAAMAQLSRGNG
jgi:hypothetical protein